MTTNHKFKQMSYTKLCGICFKPKLDEMHLDHLDESDLIASNLPTDPSFKPTEDMQIFMNESHLPPHIIKQAEEAKQPNCYGHTCIECGRSFMHEHKCWPGPNSGPNGYCPEHFAQAISDIHRNDDIANLIKPTLNTAKYLAEQRIEHTAFVVLEATKSGNYETWIQDHIQNLRSLIEQYNNKIFASTTALADLRKEDGNKLTPEEIEQYKRAAVKQKKVKENTNKEESKKEWTKMLKNLASMVGNEDIAKAQLKEIYKTQGKEIPE